MTSKNIKISVLMPAYNAEKYIAEAIESILNQTFKEFEFLIVNDGSTDRTWEIIQRYAQQDARIVALRNDRNLNICHALNRGISIARGKYIARMDADDWSYPDRLEKQYSYMEANPDVVISGGTMEVCDENLNVLNARRYHLTDETIRRKIFRYSPFCHASVIYQTKIIKTIKGYNTSMRDAEDYDLYFRLGLYGKFGNITNTLLKVRVRSHSISQQNSKKQEMTTLSIRVKATREYGYRMTFTDTLYWIGQYVSMFIIPARFKFWIFNWLRQ